LLFYSRGEIDHLTAKYVDYLLFLPQLPPRELASHACPCSTSNQRTLRRTVIMRTNRSTRWPYQGVQDLVEGPITGGLTWQSDGLCSVMTAGLNAPYLPKFPDAQFDQIAIGVGNLPSDVMSVTPMSLNHRCGPAVPGPERFDEALIDILHWAN
jgi:hypothetical protein